MPHIGKCVDTQDIEQIVKLIFTNDVQQSESSPTHTVESLTIAINAQTSNPKVQMLRNCFT